mmetsp:Transcript_55619/g.130204  ORF Transcript_55619/g.130204 Transcript_55619/m.130204 type:complete len:1444 (+) Transcript_55619:60-4391(+)
MQHARHTALPVLSALLRVWLLVQACQSSSAAATKVCYAYFGHVSDLGWTYSQNLARTWVDAELGTTSHYVEGVGYMSREEQDTVIFSLLRVELCPIIVTNTALLQGFTVDHALANPDTKFICLACRFAGAGHQPANLAAIDIIIYQAGYIAGAVAAAQAGVDRIGYVASNYVTASYLNINSFALGAMSVRPNISLLLIHAGSWFDPRTEEIAGKRLVQQHNIDLVAYDSDSASLLAMAKEVGIYSIAIKIDGTATYGESNLMSRLFRWHTPLLATVEAAILGGANWTYHRTVHANEGIREDAVGLGTFSTALSTEARILALQLEEKFAKEGDFTFCVETGAFKASCPEDARLSSAELGGAAPTDYYPCNLSGTAGVVHASEGLCLSEAQISSMTYLVDGWTNLGRASFQEACPRGTWMSFADDELCQPCQPGTASFVADAETCESCEQGRFAVDGLECRQCRSGSYSSTAGSSACSLCQPGTFSNQDSQTGCLLCEFGYFSNTSGQQGCQRCPIGTYRDSRGQRDCTPCDDGETTQYEAAIAADACVCAVGMYRDYEGICQQCPKGMSCPIGSDVRSLPGRAASSSCSSCTFPQALPSYMSLPEEPLIVYKCVSTEACPGGSREGVSSCGPYRAADAIACGLCTDGSFLNGDGECEECRNGSRIVLFVFSICGIVLAVATLAVLVNRDLLLQQNATANVVVMFGVLLTALQTTIVFNQLAMKWVDPLKSIMVVSDLASFDLGNLKLNCYVDTDPLSKLILRQMIAPACVPILFITIACRKLTKPTVNLSVELSNAVGSIFFVFFISLVATSVDAFVCYSHPSGNAGSSVVIEPSVRCWEDVQHTKMVLAATLSFCFVPANFLAFCVYAVLKYPRTMSVSNDQQRNFYDAYRFMFFRFRPQAYFYGLLLLFRHFIICLVPAVLARKGLGVQVLIVDAILVSMAVFQSTWQPWRTPFVNKTDSVTSTVLVLILHCGILNTDISASESDIAVIGTVVTLASFLFLVGAALYSMRRKVFRAAPYHHFLCHHKAFAAAQARYVQMLIIIQLRRSCFLDSDNLQDLSKLFDTVRTRVQHFVVYLTKDTLTRPWCVGEIVIAKEASLRSSKIVHWSYTEQTIADVQDVTQYLAPGMNFMDYNITSKHIIAGLAWISSNAVAAIWLNTERTGQIVLSTAVAELGGLKAGSLQNKASMRSEYDTLVISSDITDLEAVAAGGILEVLLNKEASNTLKGGLFHLADVEHAESLAVKEICNCVARARATVVILTGHSLDCLQQIEVIMVATLGAAVLIPMVTPVFTFPGNNYYRVVLPSILGGSHDRSVVRAMKTFFDQIAVPLSTHAPEITLRTEVSQVWTRVPEEEVKREKQGVLDARLPTLSSVLKKPKGNMTSGTWLDTQQENDLDSVAMSGPEIGNVKSIMSVMSSVDSADGIGYDTIHWRVGSQRFSKI